LTAQSTIAAAGNSLTPKRFKFVLQTVDTIKELKYAPKGWDKMEYTLKRDKEWKGVLISISTKELTFVKDGKALIVSAYEAHDIDYEIKVHIYLQVNGTFQYEGYFSGKTDLASYNVDSTGVTVKITKTGFQETVLNRSSIEVDMMNTKYIGGGENSMPVLATVPNFVTVPKYSANKNADWRFNGQIIGVSNYSHYLPMTNFFKEYDAVEINDQTFAGATSFFIPTDAFTGTLKGDLKIIVTGTGAINVEIWLYEHIAIKKTYLTSGTDSIEHTFTVDENIGLGAGQELYFKAYITGNNLTVTYSASSVSISQPLGTTLAAINPSMFYAFEAFARTIQLYTGQQDTLESDLLGRTDSVPVSYASDGDASLAVLTNGKLLREFSATLNGLNFSLDNLFEAFNAISPIGLGFETIGGVEKVRIEDEKYFFDITENPDFATDGKYWQTNQVLDLSEHVTNEILSKEVLPELYANEIEIGYEKFIDENIQGLKEFNTKSSYAIPVNAVKNKLSLVSPYQTGTQSTNKLRAKPFSTNPTEDVGGDNDIFMYAVKRGGAYDFTVKTDEDFESVTGGVDPSQCYNLNWTPAQNLRNHSTAIRGMQIQESKELQWLKSSKNTSLITKKAGEDQIVENADILVNDLTVGYWKPEAYNFSVPVTAASLTALKANPYGVIKLGTDMYGWIDEIQTSDKTGLGIFKLLKVDTNNVKINT